jgi:hypothetical protein
MGITKYTDCDILIGDKYNNVNPKGFPATKTFEEMVVMAMKHKCPILVRNGEGKWYLKGQNRDLNDLAERIQANAPKHRRTLWLITPDPVSKPTPVSIAPTQEPQGPLSTCLIIVMIIAIMLVVMIAIAFISLIVIALIFNISSKIELCKMPMTKYINGTANYTDLFDYRDYTYGVGTAYFRNTTY